MASEGKGGACLYYGPESASAPALPWAADGQYQVYAVWLGVWLDDLPIAGQGWPLRKGEGEATHAALLLRTSSVRLLCTVHGQAR